MTLKSHCSISVIVPFFNSAETLDRCLASLSFQEIEDAEFIFINDGCEDESAEIVSKYADTDSRFVLIEQDHEGVSSARNNGLNNASGEYLCFLDSDDEIVPCALNTMIELSSKYRLDALIHGAEVDGPEDAWQRHDLKIVNYHTNHLQFDMIFETKGFIPFVWTYMFRRESLKNHRFDTNLLVGEDAAFLFKVIPEIRRVRIIEDRLLIHHLSWQSTMSILKSDAVSYFIEHMKLVESILSDCTESQLNHGLGRWLFDIIYWSYNNLSEKSKITKQEKLIRICESLNERYPLNKLNNNRKIL